MQEWIMPALQGWPAGWDALRRGEHCRMCADLGAEAKAGGARILNGQWCDAYLGRFAVRPGYCYVIWKGRHVAEPTELSRAEACGYWEEVGRVAAAIEHRYQPLKMNWLSLGNGVPHLHVHLVPRYADDAHPGAPIEQDAFEAARERCVDDQTLQVEAASLRSLLE